MINKRTRLDILKRDNYICQMCKFNYRGPHKHLHIHHIDKNPLNNKDENLTTICQKCHLSKIHAPIYTP